MAIGMGAVAKTAEKQASGGGGGQFLQSIYWQDKPTSKPEDREKVIRFLTDDIVTAKVYQFVKGGPEGKGRDFIAPSSLVDEDGTPNFDWVPEARDYFLENDISLPDYNRNLVHASKYAKEQAYGLVVLREEVQAEVDGRRRNIVQDKIVHREWEKDGEVKVYDGPVYGYVKQGFPNFWQILVGFYNRYGTLTDRDYVITRRGNDKNTKYDIVPLDKDPDLETPEQLAAKYDPPQDLSDLMKRMCDYDQAKAWFEAKQTGDSGGSNRSAPTERRDDPGIGKAPSGSGADEEKVHSPAGGIRDRLNAYRT